MFNEAHLWVNVFVREDLLLVFLQLPYSFNQILLNHLLAIIFIKHLIFCLFLCFVSEFQDKRMNDGRMKGIIIVH